jgi:WD40 repeat protein
VLVLDGENPVAELAFTPDGTRLVVARAHLYPARPFPAEVVTVATGERQALFEPRTNAWPSVAAHPSGRLAFFAHGGPLVVADLAGGRAHEVASESVGGVAASPDGRWVVVTHFKGGHFSAYRCDPDAEPACRADWSVSPAHLNERVAGFLDGGAKFLTVGVRRFVVRDTATGEAVSEARFPAEGGVPSLSPDGTRLAVQSNSKFYLYDVATWKIRYQLATENRPFARFVYHPTKPLLAVVTAGQTLVKYMDADTGNITAKFGWRLGEVRAVCFSPDGTLCAAGTAGGKVVVWDVD